MADDFSDYQPISNAPSAAPSAEVPASGSPKAANDDFSGYEPVTPVSPIESLVRGTAEGATFGFDDKLGMDKTRRELSRQQNPWTHFAGELIGGAAPMVALPAVTGPLRAAAVAARAAGAVPTSVVRGTVAATRAAESALLPSETTTLAGGMGQGLKLGTTYGALSGAGHADVSDDDSLTTALGKRAIGAGEGAATGAVVGPVAGAIGHGIGSAIQGVAGARAAAAAETADVGSGSLQAIGRGLERDRIDPADLIAQIRSEFPDDTATAGGRRFWGNRQPWTGDQIESVVQRAMNGETPAQISDALQVNGVGPGAQAVRTVLNELGERHVGPLNLIDRAGLVRTGSGANTQMTMRAAAATPGDAQSQAREAFLERQLGANGRLGNAFDRIVGSSDFDGVAAQHTAALDTAGQAAYGAAFANERPFDLSPIIQTWNRRYGNARGPVPEAVRSGIDSILSERPIRNADTGMVMMNELVPPRNLQNFISARQNLRSAIERAQSSGDTQVVSALTQLRNELSDEVRRTNPDWGVANDLWRDGQAAQEALDAGSRMSTRLNSKTRENLQAFTDAQDISRQATRDLQVANTALRTAQNSGDHVRIDAAQRAVDQANARLAAGDARQNLFRVGLVRSLNDTILANQGDTYNLTRQLRLPGARQIMTRVLGDDAPQFYRIVDAENAMHRTFSSQFGSQTTPLREAIDDLNWAPRMQSYLDVLHPGKVLQAAADFASAKVNAARNSQMMGVMTDTDPVRQLAVLRALEQVRNVRDAANTAYREPMISTAAPLASATTATIMPKPAPRKQLPAPQAIQHVAPSAPSVSPPAVPAPKPQAPDRGQLLQKARDAIAKGAPRDKVLERLKTHGVDAGDL